MNWEYKFVFKDDRMAEPHFQMIEKMENLAGYLSIPGERVVNSDHYFDSEDLRLDSLGIVCRLRQRFDSDPKDKFRLTFKMQSLGPNGEVVYPETIEDIQEDRFNEILQHGLYGDALSILGLFAGSSPLANVLFLKVIRRVLALHETEESEPIAYLNLDRIEAKLPGDIEPRAKSYEIELKTDRPNFPEADMLQDFLRNAFNLVPVTRSKARRLVRLMRKETRERRKVFFDMDTGVDDALAILMAMNSPELELLAITSVGGNIGAEQAAQNTAAVLGFVREQMVSHSPELSVTIPAVACGIDPPKHEGGGDASDVHGPDGLGGVSSKHHDPSISIEPDALALFQRVVGAHPAHTITLVTTGPLTNLAYWIREAPETVKNLKEIVCMGGVFFESGNRSQTAEFNIHADPDSASRVVEFCRQPVSTSRYSWRETMPLTFIGLDVTHRVRFRRDRLEKALEGAGKDPFLRERLEFIKEFTRFYMDFYYRNEGLDGCYLHDPLAVGYVIDPALYYTEQYHVEVEDQGRWTAGMSVADYRPTRLFKDKMKECTWVCYKIDTERFEKLFFDRLIKPYKEPTNACLSEQL